MTIRELYQWAEQHNCLDIQVYKNSNLDMYPIKDVFKFDSDLAAICDFEPRVVLD